MYQLNNNNYRLKRLLEYVINQYYYRKLIYLHICGMDKSIAKYYF